MGVWEMLSQETIEFYSHWEYIWGILDQAGSTKIVLISLWGWSMPCDLSLRPLEVFLAVSFLWRLYHQHQHCYPFHDDSFDAGPFYAQKDLVQPVRVLSPVYLLWTIVCGLQCPPTPPRCPGCWYCLRWESLHLIPLYSALQYNSPSSMENLLSSMSACSHAFLWEECSVFHLGLFQFLHPAGVSGSCSREYSSSCSLFRSNLSLLAHHLEEPLIIKLLSRGAQLDYNIVLFLSPVLINWCGLEYCLNDTSIPSVWSVWSISVRAEESMV